MKNRYTPILALALAMTSSAAVVTAENVAPCTLAVTDSESFATDWTVIDANGDGSPYLWAFDPINDQALYTENKKGAADDWLISPAVTLEAGKSYRVSFNLRNASTFTSDKQKFKILAGNAPEISALTDELYKNETLTKSTYNQDFVCTKTFNPTETGEYYFAIYCYSASYNGNFLFKSFTVEELVAHPGAVTSLTATAAPKGAMSVDLAWTWPTVTDLGGALDEIGGANIYRGTTSTFSATEATLVGTVEGGTPGETATWTDTSVETPGKYYYRVIPFNEQGTSTATSTAVQTEWVGPDSGIGTLKNVVATPVADDDHAVAITFDTPLGSNGGYIDPSAVSYKIVRTGTSTGTVTLEESWSGELPYIDRTIESLDSYVYKINTIYNGSTSWSAVSSNTVITGGAMGLPYTQSFDNAASLEFFTLFHGEGATRDWGYYLSKVSYWGNPADAWLVTPKFELEAGSPYELTFDTWVSRATSPKDLYVYIGTSPDAEGFSTELFHETVSVAYQGSGHKTITLSVPETGIYYIAFRCFGPSNSEDIYIDDLGLKQIEIVPGEMTAFTATAAAEGAMAVNLAWVNPAVDNVGNELPSLTKVEIYRGKELLATLEDVVPGATGQYTDSEITETGIYTYSICGYLGAKQGPEVSATTGWVGIDTPVAPADLKLTVADDGSRQIEWSAVTEGVNGGYVDAEAVTYTVSRGADILAEDCKETSFTDSEEDLPLASYTYSVSATCAGLTSQSASTEPVILGDALSLPYKPDFTSDADFGLWTAVNPDGTKSTVWKYDSSKKAFSCSFSSTKPWAFTPPFKAQEGLCRLDYKGTCYNSRYTEDVDIYLCKTNNPADVDDFTLLEQYHVESVSWPNLKSVEFDVPATGTYYIGYHVVTDDNWSFNLLQSDVEQVSVNTTGIGSVSADGSVAYLAAEGAVVAAAGATVDIYDLTGRLIVSAVADAEGRVSVASLTDALYIAVVTDPSGAVSSMKFVKK